MHPSANTHWWRYRLTIFFVIIGYILGQIPFIFYALYKDTHAVIYQKPLTIQNLNADPTLFLLLILFSFICAFIWLWAGLKWILKIPLISIITTNKRIDYKKIAYILISIPTFPLFIELITYCFDNQNYTFQFNRPIIIYLLSLF